MDQASGNPSSDTALRVEGLHMRYGRRGVHALRGVSFAVGRGECFGLLGPNGAGKTTLMKVLMTAIHPTAGAAWLLGRPIGDRRVLARVGYVPESFEFPPYLTPRKLLHYTGMLSGVGRADRRQRIGRLLELVGMADWIDTPIKRFSKGMTQRVALAQGLINQPDLLFLDEPTEGLDPVGRAQFRDLIRQFHRDGVTVFLNSHLLNEVEQVCTRVAVLAGGQVLRVGSPETLVPAKGVPYQVRVAGPVAEAAALLAEFRPRIDRDVVELELSRVEQIDGVIDRLRAASIRILEVVQPRASLEAQFLQLLGAGNSQPADGPPSQQAAGGDAIPQAQLVVPREVRP